ncbi:MAG: ribulose-phosphate 3-epimerase [Sphingomonadales bacterium]|nr:ribulose-phosphate 3-epimerase [Sphingomonadales bacterium]
MAIIAASILDADFSNLKNEVNRADTAGVDMFTLDIMDGHFAPRITFGDYVVSQIRSWTDRPIEAHLMLERPENWVDRFVDAGVDLVVFHAEATSQHRKIIDNLRNRGVAVGMALLSSTPVDTVYPWIEDLDVVNFLAVPVGFGGQSSAPDTFDRIRDLRATAEGRHPGLVIEVDGGVKPTNADEYVNAGADMLTVGTGLYHAPDLERAVSELRERAETFQLDRGQVLLGSLRARREAATSDHEAVLRAAGLVGARD